MSDQAHTYNREERVPIAYAFYTYYDYLLLESFSEMALDSTRLTMLDDDAMGEWLVGAVLNMSLSFGYHKISEVRW
jgi:hypothetical protein